MSVAKIPTAEIFYQRTGTTGDPAVLVHGSWTDHHGWDAVVPGFAQGVQVLAYDRRGHGLSRGPARSRPVREDAGDLAALLELEDFHPVHLIAHEYGGMVALRLAIDRPELVRSVSIHEPPWVGLLERDPSDLEAARSAARDMDALASAPQGEGVTRTVPREPGLLSADGDEWDRIPASARASILPVAPDVQVEFRDPEATDADVRELVEVQVPALVTVGKQSATYVQRIAERLAGNLPNATLVRLPGAGHFPQLTHPDLFVGVLGTFLLERNVPTT